MDCTDQSGGSKYPGKSSMLIDLDACTDGQKVFKAYNDAQRIHAQFILNAIDHANAVLGYSAFDKQYWKYMESGISSLDRTSSIWFPGRTSN